jgi:hypothetical protein
MEVLLECVPAGGRRDAIDGNIMLDRVSAANLRYAGAVRPWTVSLLTSISPQQKLSF